MVVEEVGGGDCCAVVMGGSCDRVGWGVVLDENPGGLGCPGNPGPAVLLHPKRPRGMIITKNLSHTELTLCLP